MEFALRNGPWKTVFEGKFEGHALEIAINPDQRMLVAIYEKEADETKGVVLQAFSIFSTAGELETFVESLQQEAVVLSRHDGKRTMQFLAMPSSLSYAKASQEEIAKTVDSLLEEVNGSTGKIMDVARSFDLHLTPLKKCSSAVKQAFFSQPVVIPMLTREKKILEFEEVEERIRAGTDEAAVLLGITKAGKQVKEPLQMFKRCFVSEGKPEQRNHFIQIIIESYLLSNIPVVIFDKGNNFSGLSHPTQKIAELQSHGMQAEPIGFPTKDFKPGENIKINLNIFGASGLLQMFGCSDKESEKILAAALEKEKVLNVKQLVRNIDSLNSEKAENLFLKKRVERIVSLLEVLYPEMFDGATNVGEIVKTWFKKIGRASIVHIDGLDPRELTLLFDSLLNELIALFKQQGTSSKLRLLVAIPKIEPIFSIRDNLVLKDFIKILSEMQKFGIGFVLGAEIRSDFGKTLLRIAETKAGIIKENDVALDLPDSKNYRILMRPTLSTQKETMQK